MARHARITVPGLPLHIVHRGINRMRVFYSHDDYSHYLANLSAFASEFACDIHAYVLMTNHVHLLVTPQREDSVAQMMKRVAQRHAQRVNRGQGRTGSLWEGRFRSSLIENDYYALACYRYIEMNPVRAGMVSDPALYRWSSHQANANGDTGSIICAHPAYLGLANETSGRVCAYRKLFVAGLNDEELRRIRNASIGNHPLRGERPDL